MTIYDIAKIAGVSASSVSRVINNKSGVNPETRKKVQKLLEKYNYVPNVVAQGLVNSSSKTIGILLADVREVHHVDGAYYIERELLNAGYITFILNTGHKDEEKVNAVEILARRRVEGVIMMGSIFQCDDVRNAIEKHLDGIPVIIINGYLDLPNVYGVITDEKKGIEMCLEHLYERGKHKPAFVVNLPYNPSNTSKEAGFRDFMQRMKQKPEKWIYGTENTLEGGQEATDRVLKDHPDVDAIVYSLDILASGGLRSLSNAGIKVPDEIAVTGFNNSIYAKMCTPAITSLDNKRKDASLFAARILIDHISGKTNPSHVILVPELVVRDSS